jgi:hypothetical protein
MLIEMSVESRNILIEISVESKYTLLEASTSAQIFLSFIVQELSPDFNISNTSATSGAETTNPFEAPACLLVG